MKKLSTTKLIDTVIQKRKDLKMTQAQLSEMTGMNRSMVGRLENGEYMPSIEQIESLGEVLGFEYADLLEEVKTEKRSVTCVSLCEV